MGVVGILFLSLFEVKNYWLTTELDLGWMGGSKSWFMGLLSVVHKYVSYLYLILKSEKNKKISDNFFGLH
jgi:hypothetical protein